MERSVGFIKNELVGAAEQDGNSLTGILDAGDLDDLAVAAGADLFNQIGRA